MPRARSTCSLGVGPRGICAESAPWRSGARVGAGHESERGTSRSGARVERGTSRSAAELPLDLGSAHLQPPHDSICDTRATMSEELRPSDVARQTGVSLRTVQRWIATGRLPARRVGGRWRVASDAFDALMGSSGAVTGPGGTAQGATAGPGVTRGPGAAAGPDATPPPRTIRRVFIANRGEIARRIARTCDRLGIAVIVPTTDGPAPSTSSTPPPWSPRLPPRMPMPSTPGSASWPNAPTSPRPSRPPGSTWIGPPPAAIRAMGDKAAARRLAASLDVPDDTRLRRPGPVGRGPGGRCHADRHAAPHQAGGRRRRQGHAHRARPGSVRRRSSPLPVGRHAPRSVTSGSSSSD